jgi:histidine kinase/DNA gyrase B/HSP90-like ATPase
MPATDNKTKKIDFLGTRPRASVEAQRQLHEAENVLSSYSRATDLLAEALQNATDAIDARSEAEKDAERRIDIEFDVGARRFTVTDTGTGISDESLQMVLTPNVTLKTGQMAVDRVGRSRGEKGVGLSFLVLASDFLHIRTCDGTERNDVVVRNANSWVQSGGQQARPEGEQTTREADELRGSERYTSVTVERINTEAFDRDLFDLGREELDWILRTATSLGNTAPLFESLGREQPEPIEARVCFKSGAKPEGKWSPLPYRYATPEDLVPDLEVIDSEDLAGMSGRKIASVTKGKGVRYVARFESKAGKDVDLYVFIFNGVDMRRMLLERREEKKYIPDDWQSLEVATRDMPTGIKLSGGVISPRTLERRVFALFQYDELKLDLGRKTLAGPTSKMLGDVLKEAWEEDLAGIIPHVGAADRTTSNVGRAALDSAVKRGKAQKDLGVELPYLKDPDKAVGVMALFHELLGRGAPGLPLLRTLRTGVFGRTDSLIYVGNPNGEPPRHVVFAKDSHDLIRLLEDDEERTETVNLAVLWTLGSAYLEKTGVEYEEVKGRETGATHQLSLAGRGEKDDLEVVVLSDALEELAR